MSQSVCLVLIVKNEASIIRRCIESAAPLLSCVAIVDTGSSDGTEKEAIEAAGDARLPCVVRREPWVDFATNRNQALELGRQSGADWLLLLDADEELTGHVDAGLPKLSGDGYGLRFRLDGSEATWVRLALLRADAPWEFEGAVHEDLKTFDGMVTGLVEGIGVQSHTDGARGAEPDQKFRDDLCVLRKMWETEPSPRIAFYMAQSWAGLKAHPNAVFWYQKRAEMGGWDQEVWYSMWQAGVHKQAQGAESKAIKLYLKAYEMRPQRAEPLWALAVLHNDRGEHNLAELYAQQAFALPMTRDLVMVVPSVYEWRAGYELAAALGKQGRFTAAQLVLETIRQAPSLTDTDINKIEANLSECASALAA